MPDRASDATPVTSHAVTLTGPPDAIAPEVVRLARSGITEVVVYPLALDGGIETTVQRFQGEVMPRVRAELG